MIVVDSSVIIAIMKNEPEALDFLTLLKSSNEVALGAVSFLECGMVIYADSKVAGLHDLYELLFNNIGVTIYPFEQATATLAVQAFQKYGKGNHKARLNMGDCASYALAKQLDAALLFKGGDFAVTDVKTC